MEITKKELLIIDAALKLYLETLEFEQQDMNEQADEVFDCIEEAIEFLKTDVSELWEKIDSLLEGGEENANRK